MEKRIQDTRDVAISTREGQRHSLDEGWSRIIGHKIGHQLPGNPPRSRGMPAKNIESLLDLREPSAFDRMSQESLVAMVVATRVKLEEAIPNELALQFRSEFGVFCLQIHANTREDAGQFF